MKRIAYSFFLLSLFSCGSSSHVNYHTWVRTQDSILHDYSLIAVRTNELLVTSYRVVPYAGDTVFSVPFSGIKQVFQEHETSNTGTYVGGAVGFAAGFLGVYLSHSQIHGQLGNSFIPLVTLAAGSLIGHNFDKNISEYDVSQPDEVLLLKKFSQYTDTKPPEHAFSKPNHLNSKK